MIFSCFGILIIGALSFAVGMPSVLITQFQVSAIYLIACSLAVTVLQAVHALRVGPTL